MNTTAELTKEIERLTQALVDKDLALMEQTEIAQAANRQAEELRNRVQAQPLASVDSEELLQLVEAWVSSSRGSPAGKAWYKIIAHIDAHTAAVTAKAVANAEHAKESAVQQAQQHAMEARTQRATVLEILRHFGCPEEDWHALELIKAAQAQSPVAATDFLEPLYRWMARARFERTEDELTAARFAKQIAEFLAAPQQHAQAAQKTEGCAGFQGKDVAICGPCNGAGCDGEAAPTKPIAGELPQPMKRHIDRPEGLSFEVEYYTADQMRNYGHQCRAAALEAAEKVCSNVGDGIHDQSAGVAYHCSSAIRALNKTEGA